MKSREVIIKVTSDKVYFNNDLALPLSSTNLPCENLNADNIFWQVQQLKYEPDDCCLIVKVTDYFYRLENDSEFNNQQPKKAIQFLQFHELISPKMLKSAINYYKKNVLKKSSVEIRQPLPSESILNIPDLNNDPYIVPQPVEKLKKTFSIHFKDANFKLGYVTFDKYIPELRQAISFEIENEDILAEYEYVKSYFPKVLKKRQFKVYVTIKYQGNKILDVFARSSDIDLINSGLIESIKISRTLDLTKKPVKDPDKSLFTSDEIFDAFNDNDQEGNIFRQSEEDILNFLIDVKKVRNRKQLEYLAGLKQSAREKLRFTLHPHFGFLFLIEGRDMWHFCWELLNSHATYIWSCEKKKKLNLQVKRVERIINSIRTIGRQQYKMAYYENHVDEDLSFSVINHERINSNFVDGFVSWKHRLNERLV